MKIISDLVKSFGGSGKINGLIVDISENSHIFFNPLDGKIIPYFKTETINKKTYDDVDALLKIHEQLLAKNYCYSTSIAKGELSTIGEDVNMCYETNVFSELRDRFSVPIWGANFFKSNSYEIDIYGLSNLFLNFKRTHKFIILKSWDERIVENEENSILTIFKEAIFDGYF